MEKVLLRCGLLSFIILVSACSSFDRTKRLVIAPAETKPISSIDSVLQDLYAERKPLLIYIHGRGNEPKKSRKEGILESLEKEYDVKVLMFNWDSKAFLLSRPVEKAHEGAPYFTEVVKKIIEFRENNEEAKTIPISLLVHSMGNIVLRKAIETDLTLVDPDGELFTNILMTGSDEDAEDHNKWLEKLKAKGIIMVTINKNDFTLKHSGHDDGKSPLGINLAEPIASNAYYLDMTGLVGNVHRIFQKGGQHSNDAICRLITSMVRSESPNINSNLIAETNGKILIPSKKKDSICFKGVLEDSALEEDDNQYELFY